MRGNHDMPQPLLGLALFMLLSLTVCTKGSWVENFIELEEVSRILGKYNKPAVKSIQSPDGDTIDCVLIHKQPAFDHPLLKNHIIQLSPSVPFTGLELKNVSHSRRQLWNENDSCPAGTIPIRRLSATDVARTKNITRFGMKDPGSTPPMGGDTPLADSATHEHAYAYLYASSLYGTKCDINVWNPLPELPSDFSLAQLWVIATGSGGINTVEAGWQVYKDLYGDYLPRLFIYWTTDGYKNTGCYNLACSAFVQTNKNIVLGGSVSPVSTYGGTQYQITILVWKDPNSGNWWVNYQGQNVGYYPSSLFNYLNSYATLIEWGGEVAYAGSSHTTTPMGSGHFPSEGYGKAAYIANILTVDGTNTYVQPSSLSVGAEKPSCYYSTFGTSSTLGDYILFGGPGKSANCP